MAKRFFILLIFISVAFSLKAQKANVVQFSCVLSSSDTMHKPIPFVTIYDFQTGLITISNYEGFFSLVALEGDTIQLESLGFRTKLYVVPHNITDKKLSVALTLDPTFFMLKEQIVYPWGTRDQFPNAFVHTPIPDDDLARAKRNLNPDVIRSMLANAPADPDINARRVLTNYAASLYYYGQAHPISLLNPLAWAQFINDIKAGKYKNPDNDNSNGNGQ